MHKTNFGAPDSAGDRHMQGDPAALPWPSGASVLRPGARSLPPGPDHARVPP
ncbi:hypothetical protein QJS66_13605 [Kocuria rhizophila]|nr:hypothetical protein QJS66_13605 [Kocuria rhizophila]